MSLDQLDTIIKVLNSGKLALTYITALKYLIISNKDYPVIVKHRDFKLYQKSLSARMQV